jgi:hypothetical protein
MEEEDDQKENKKEENGPGFLNKKMEQIFLKKDLFIYGVLLMISLQRILSQSCYY